MREYHFLVSSLPELFFEKKGQQLNFVSFIEELKVYLHPDDFKLVTCLLLEIDNENVLTLLSKKNRPFKDGGNFTLEQLENEIKNPQNLPGYLKDFILYYQATGNKKTFSDYEKLILTNYYSFVNHIENDFLKTWFDFELTLKNIITSVLSGNYGLRPETEMIGEKTVIDEILFYRSKNFDLGHRLPNYQKLLQVINLKDLIEREKSLDQFRWNFLNEITLFKYFTIDVILSYTLKMKILKRWESLDEEQGKTMFNAIIDELQNPNSI